MWTWVLILYQSGNGRESIPQSSTYNVCKSNVYNITSGALDF